MSTSITPEDRQQIIANNRSLRNIKNELESLSNAGLLSDEAYEIIMEHLPSESSLKAPRGNAGVSPALTGRTPVSQPSPVPPTDSFTDLRVNDPSSPPAYSNPTLPHLPTREAAKPSPPELGSATALYKYTSDDSGDCQFEVGDKISITKYINDEWWFGKNLRTGKEGVFPVNYVEKAPAPLTGYYGNEKNNGYGQQGYQQGYNQGFTPGPPAPGPSNPYNSAVPPMQIAEQPSEHKPGKGEEMGKKFGKKLGNAAIFGAGATIGGNIVNSIF